MITYTATNTKTGQFYIGSAKNYCCYMERVGTHHKTKPGKRGYTRFHKDLQEDPLSFKWEWSEDDRDDRNTESSLIRCYGESEFIYNCQGKHGKHIGPSVTPEYLKKHSKRVKKDWEDAENRRVKQSEWMKEVANRKVQCPHCDLVSSPAGIANHIRARHTKG